MSFDKFLLAVESRDLSQADMSNIRVSSFPKLCDGSRTVNFIIQKLLWKRSHSYKTFIIDRSLDSRAKRNLSKDM